MRENRESVLSHNGYNNKNKNNNNNIYIYSMYMDMKNRDIILNKFLLSLTLAQKKLEMM